MQIGISCLHNQFYVFSWDTILVGKGNGVMTRRVRNCTFLNISHFISPFSMDNNDNYDDASTTSDSYLDKDVNDSPPTSP
ncbi:hypothetical protein LXL04_021206 [Taraxacum kok-saghyz]